METLSRIYRIQYEDLRKMVNHMALARRKIRILSGGRAQKEKRKQGRRRTDCPEAYADLAYLLSEMFDTIEGYIGPEDFTTPLYHQVAQLVFAQHEEGSGESRKTAEPVFRSGRTKRGGFSVSRFPPSGRAGGSQTGGAGNRNAV